MKTKNLLILAAVVMALLAYILLFERHQPTSDEARRNAEKVFPDLDQDNVNAILIETTEGRVRLEKSDEAWRLREPLDYPADGSTVGTTLTTLAGLSADRRLPVAEVTAADYGLDDPAAKVTLTLDDNSEISFAVGDEMPLGSKRALLVADDDEIEIVPGWFMTDLERGADDWRSREVTDLRTDQVASIEIDAGDDSIRAVHVGDAWQLLSPIKDVADRDHLEGLVSDLDALRIEEFLDSADVDLESLGLAAPEYSIMVVRSDGAEPLRLDLGATREGSGGTEVACRRGDDDYFWAQDRVRTRLSKAPVLWRAKKVADFDTWNANGLRLSTPDNAVELEKVDSRWRFAGDAAEADQARVSDRLNALSKLEATDYDLMAPMTDELGRAEIVLVSDDGDDQNEVITFTFFAPLSEGGRAMVQVSGRDTVMGVESSDVQSILADFDDLRPTAAPVDDSAAE